MRKKFLLGVLLAGCALSSWADGYNDGIEYYKAGQYKNAKTVLDRTLNEAGTDKALAYYYLGQIAMVNGDKQKAKENFDKGIAANAENPYNYVGLGAIDLSNGNANGAEANFKQAQKLGKKNNEITVDIARAYYNADPVKYEKEVKKYIDKAHKDSKNAEPSIYILEGDMLFDQKDLGAAAAKYEQAIGFEQDNPEGYVKFATAYMGVNPQFTLEKLEELLAKQPNSALAQRELAERYYENNQWSKAAEQYGRYMSNPNHFPEDKARYLVLVYANSDYPKSVVIADEILAKDPESAQALRVKMLALKELKDYAKAKTTAEKFFSLKFSDPSKAPYNQADYANFGTILMETGDTIAATQAMEKALQLDPTKLDNYKALSSMYTNAEMFDKAAEALERAIPNVGENFGLTEYYTLSGRWLNAASRAETPEAASTMAAKGVAAVDKVISGVDAANLQPSYLQRKALLLFLQDNKQVTPQVGEAYLALKNALDADPSNTMGEGVYKQMYQILYLYFDSIGDKEKADEMMAKFTELSNK